jgi:DNA polymerase-3 subunit gamma/tau
MRDALSLTDQAIAFGSGRLCEREVRAMLGTVDLDFVYRLLEAIAAGEPAALLEVSAHMAQHAPDFEGSLDELTSLLHRVAIAQAVPKAVDGSRGDAARVADFARAITAEDLQLFYQMAINGKRDLALAPDLRAGFEMILLRMVAFRPAAFAGEIRAAEELPQQPGCGATAKVAAGEVGQPREKKIPEAPQGAVASAPGVERADTGAGAGSASEGLDRLAARPLEPGDWPELLERLGLAGIVYNIASHCELRASGGGRLQFVLDPEHGSLFNDSHSVKLRLALENYFGREVSLSISPGDIEGETPAMRRARLAGERQREAVAEIEGDVRLQALIARFDGELDRSSIVPLDS